MARIRLALAVAASTLLPLTVGTAGAASAAPTEHQPLAIHVVGKRVHLLKSGDVVVKVAARCDTGLDAFEVDLGVTQGTAVAADTPRGDFPVCDGRWHTQRFVLPVLQGRFHHGTATANAFLAAYSDATGDLSAESSRSVRLK